jgi:hypothetical protein
MATQRSVVVAILLQALLCVFYTSAVNAELGAGRARRVVLFSLCNGALLLGIPVAFHFAALNMAYAPVVATALSLVFAVSFRGLGWSLLRGSVQSTARRFHWTHFRRSFVKQGQLSFGTIVDAVLVWAGVVIAASAYGFEAGAIYRLVMSAVALLTQVIPMPKQALLRVARSAASQAWAGKYAAVLVLCGALQVAAVYVAGRAGIARAFPAYVEYIYHGVLVLSPVAALKCILEIQTILYDRRNMLSRLIWNSLTAAVPGLVAGLLLDVFWGILAFYLAVVVLSAGAFRLERRVEKLHEGPVQPDDGE